MARLIGAFLAAFTLAACTQPPPESAASAAADQTCTAQGDATYHSLSEDQLARTSQNGLLYSPTTHVFDAERLGALHERDSEIANCERNGTGASSTLPAGGGVLSGNIVTPHIVQTP
jgi:hypothetical protein